MMNSREAPVTSQEKEEFVKKYEDVYGKEFGQMIRESWPRWGKFAAKKLVAKLAINSVWGKHAQRVDFPETVIYSFASQKDEIGCVFQNAQENRIKDLDIQYITADKASYTFKSKDAKINLHGQYMPTASFVPEYGRLQLWEQMNKLGDRVLYCDTDSIIYLYDPEKYNVPTGDMIGDWEVEDICKHGISEFVSWGPKTYGIRCDDGYESIKAKGVSLKRATESIMNFEIMKDTVLAFLEENHIRVSNIPSTNFQWNLTGGMKTILNFKRIMIKPGELKGFLKDGYIYPFGYEF
jgi:hypothetical protein